MYCILLNSTRNHYVPYLKFLLENKPNSFEVVEYNSISTINWESLAKYDYVIIVSRYCYINFSKLVEFCSTQHPNLAALSTYWGIGFPYVGILSKKTILHTIDTHNNHQKSFEDETENFLSNIFMSLAGLDSTQELLSQSEAKLLDLCEINNILSLDKYVYISNINYTEGYFHNSIFVSFNDEEDKFVNFLEEYHSGKKYVKYKHKPYILPIGSKFFVIKKYHVGILDSSTIVYWDRNLSEWKKAGPKLVDKISSYMKKNFNIDLDSPAT